MTIAGKQQDQGGDGVNEKAIKEAAKLTFGGRVGFLSRAVILDTHDSLLFGVSTS